MNVFSILSKTVVIATLIASAVGAHLHQFNDLHSLIDYNSLPFKLSTSMNVDYHSPDGCTRYRQLGDQIFVTQYCDKNGEIPNGDSPIDQSSGTTDGTGSDESVLGGKDDIEGLKALRAMIKTTKGKRNHKRSFKHKRFARFHRF